MILYVFQTSSPSTYLTLFNVVLALIALITLIGGSIIILLLKKRDTVSAIQLERANANEGLAKVHKAGLEECEKKCEKCREELESVTAELKTQMGLDVTKLMEYWQIRESEMAKMAQLESVIRQYKMRVGDPL